MDAHRMEAASLFGSWTRRINIALLGPALALGLAVPAQAAGVNVTAAPAISGSAVVGAKLTANGGAWTGPSGTTVGRIWLRCSDNSSTSSCAWIGESNSTTYTLTAADKGKWIRVTLYAFKGSDYDWMTSNATAVVAAAPTPTPTPTPAKAPAPVISPTPTPVSTPAVASGEVPAGEPTPEPVAQPLPAATIAAEAAATPSTTAKPAAKAKPKMIRPYPAIRISGTLTSTGADIALLTVKAPKGVRITLTCAGKGCPLREVAQATALFHIQQFERELRAGTKLTITVTKPGYITKVTTILIRRGKGPQRSDRCALPSQTKLIACPKR